MPTHAQHAGAHSLPNAEDLLDGHVQAIGGERALLALTSRVSRGKLAVKMGGHDFVASIEERAVAPNKIHTSIGGDFFNQVTVCDGERGWEWRPGHGHGDASQGDGSGTTAFLKGSQKTRLIDKSRFNAALNWHDGFAQVKTVGLAEVDGAPAYEVQMTRLDDEQYANFYDKETGRLVKRVRNTSTAMDQMGMVVFYRDYREFDNVWVATTVHAELNSPSQGEGTQTWTFSEIEHNTKISKPLFDVPEELMEAEHAH
ncbi:MAG: hypothetical protein ACI8QZ_002992 [Chlamydiales bacterium]|jgi:hypothetical protein